MSSKTIYDAFKDKSLKVNAPISEEKLNEILKNLEIQPSEELINFWKNVGSGFIESLGVAVSDVGQLHTFSKDEYDYENYEEIVGKKAFPIGIIWEGTDSSTPIYEIAEGEDKGLLLGFSYGDLSIYKSKIKFNELLEFVKCLSSNIDYSEFSDKIFHYAFQEKIQKTKND
ncbi:hypothetical protein GPJ56_002299 [Histomonas meleagridis]|uniref:uncharacterized protein n=1 Tax=Histomonas meleagridis TaxID=135588 RepID=UPI00355A080A|nr:hypothetical protein GPJ56_002299 [Histomonas meleagridis]KAH0804560.1 hypothetical protein GO595_003390 [Histomonas meleagridis]